MLVEKKLDGGLRGGLLAGGMSLAGSALGFFIVFLAKGIQGNPVFEWYVITVLFTVASAIFLVTWYAIKKGSEQVKLTFIVTAVAGILSAAASIIVGFLFIP
ncbi:hypothetical protein RQN30_06735 [Arcanobacterium hippocoleae]